MHVNASYDATCHNSKNTHTIVKAQLLVPFGKKQRYSTLILFDLKNLDANVLTCQKQKKDDEIKIHHELQESKRIWF